jgi:mRNA interferase RelE/StbE
VPYEVRVTRTATRQLTERLPETAAAACAQFLYGPLAADPHRVGAPLRKPYEGYWRARRGEYRVRYIVEDGRRVVTVADISHRRDAYR